MKMNEFQKQAIDFALYPENIEVIYTALGLAGEAGEVCEKIKKIIRSGKDIRTEAKYNFVFRGEVAKEIGDCLWYIANICNDFNFNMETIAKMNIDKLEDRRKRGILHGEGDNR